MLAGRALMPKARLDGFRKPLDTGQRKKVRLARISQGQTDGGIKFAQCSCGAPFTQRRDKVRDAAIDKHVKTKHNGMAVWI